MKRIITLALSLIIVLNCVPFVAVAETAPAVELFYYDGDAEVAIGTGYATLAEAIAALNADTADNRHFLIKLNEDVTLSGNENARTITNTNFSTSRTVTVHGQAHMLTLTSHNGIYVGPTGGTKEINLNIKNLEIYHQYTGSAIQYRAPGTLSTSNCLFTADGSLMTESNKTDGNNYAIVNALVSGGQKCTMNFKNTKFNISRQSNFTNSRSAAVILTGNGNNLVDVNLDNCTIDTSKAEGGVVAIYATNVNSTVNISITDAEIYTPPGVYAITTDKTGESAAETVSLSLGRMGFMNKVDDTVTVIYDMDTAINPDGGFKKPTKFTGYTTVGGYNTFPDLVITEVHLDSIEITSGAGPFSSRVDAQRWTDMAWWGSDHPTANDGSVAGEFFRYIEVYNASDNRINLYDYELAVDTNALENGSTVNVLNIGGGNVGSAQNPAAAYLGAGETAIIWIYNSVDEYLLADADNFRGYYGWRYAGDDDTVSPAPGAKDQYLNVDLSDTLVLAVNDISGRNSKTSTLLGDFENDPVFYGLVKKNAGSVTEDKDNWTSWAYFEHYDKTTASNQADQSTFNFLYGLDSGGDIREGRRLNEGRVTYNCNPGLLQEVQKLNFPNVKDDAGNSVSFTPDITITEINNYMENGMYDYIEVANISSQTINIYDYCILGRYDIFEQHLSAEKKIGNDFSVHWFDRVNYIIPGDVGDIQSFTTRKAGTVEGEHDMSPYTGADRQEVYSNPARAEGELAPGETAILWMYDIECYIDSAELSDFTTYYSENIGESTKIFAMSGYRNQIGDDYTDASGETRYNQSIGISNSSCEIYGIARLDSFERTETSEDKPYAEIKKEQLSYENTTLTRTGFSILECDCAVFMYSSMINGGSNDNAQLELNGEKGNIAYQYAAAYVDGAALRFAGFLSTLREDDAGSVVTEEWRASPNLLLASQKALISTFNDNLYTVTFEQNGGVGESATYFVRPGHMFDLPNEIYTNSDLFLIGWSTDPGATADSADFFPIGTAVELTGNTKYYAIWSNRRGDPSYSVDVPTVMTIDEFGAGSIKLSAELIYFISSDVLSVTVTSASGFMLTLDGDENVKIPYKLTSVHDGVVTELENGDVAASFTTETSGTVYIDAEITAPPSYAGSYTDTLTFTVTMQGATR